MERGKRITLKLAGYTGMSGDQTKKAVSSAEVSTWNNGTLAKIGTTDKEGKVSFRFDKNGTYIVTAKGTAQSVVNGGDDNGGLWLLIKSSKDASGKTIYGKMDWSTYESYIAYTEKDYGDGPYPYDEIKYVDFSDFDADAWTSEKGYLLYSGNMITNASTIAPACIVTVKDPVLSRTSVTAKGSSWTSVKVSWKKVKNAREYQVYRASKKNGTYKKVKTTAKLSWTDKKRKTGQKYYYKVKAVASGYKASTSRVKSAKAVAKVPALKLTAGKNTIRATWTKVNGSTGYKLYRATAKNGTYKVIRNAVGADRHEYTSINKKTGKKYYYKIRAYKKSGKKTFYSAYSPVKVKAAK